MFSKYKNIVLKGFYLILLRLPILNDTSVITMFDWLMHCKLNRTTYSILLTNILQCKSNRL